MASKRYDSKNIIIAYIFLIWDCTLKIAIILSNVLIELLHFNSFKLSLNFSEDDCKTYVMHELSRL